MSLVIGIQSCPSGNGACARHWPYFEKAGADELIGIGTTCGGTIFPLGVRSEMIGANLYITGKHLPRRLIRSFELLLKTKHDWLCVAEYDVIFLREIPKDLPLGVTAHLAGGKPFDCHCNMFLHGPWICDRETAKIVIAIGHEILQTNEVDPSPDCFLGQIIEKGEIPFRGDILKSYSRNTIHPGQWAQEAREARFNGAICVHGVKDAQVLNEIME
ncbi:MAG: hypothetical protein WBD81_17930 [Collimonas pratensis]|uniref:hypothetical protein n=1 Tax=Collimonas pratensis TaxID=279113 RepID=UPI003C747DC9